MSSRFNERGARVSPDGRWVSYTSNEYGADEVYVRPFPSLEGRTQVSTGGGSEAVWSPKGNEIFYRGGGAIMAVGIAAAGSLTAAPPHKLFDDRYYSKAATHISYDVSRDGRFLMAKAVPNDQGGNSGPSFVVVLNWLEELKTRMASK